MTDLFETRRRLLEIVVPAIMISLLGYFAYHALQGQNGLLAYLRLDKELAIQERLVADISAEREALEHRVHLMRPSSIDPDMLDEQVRAVLGYAREGEVIIYLDEDGPKK